MERELRRVAERSGIRDFTIAYWDWTPMESSLFTEKLFGTPEYCSREVDVKGDLFDENLWPVVYDYHFRLSAPCSTARTLSNIYMDRKENLPLRCGKMSSTNNGDDNEPSPFLPDANTIILALRADRYADGPNFTTDTGFTKHLQCYL